MGSSKENKYVNEPHQREFYYLKYDLSQMSLYLGRLLKSSTQSTSVLTLGLKHQGFFTHIWLTYLQSFRNQIFSEHCVLLALLIWRMKGQQRVWEGRMEMKVYYSLRLPTTRSLECPWPAWTPVPVLLGTLIPWWRVTLTCRDHHTMDHVLWRSAELQASS